MDASPAKRRVLGALDPNACSPKVRSDGKAQLSPVKAKAVGTRPVLSPTRASTSPSSTPQKDAESRKRSSPTPAPEETVSRAGGDEELDSEPAPKRPCLDSNVREDAQPRRAKSPPSSTSTTRTTATTTRHRSASPDSPSVFDTSAVDNSQTTILTEPDTPAPALSTAPPAAPAPRPRPRLTREQTRQKAEILRLRLGLASYKVRTGQTDVPLDRLEAKHLRPSSRAPGLSRAGSFSHDQSQSQYHRRDNSYQGPTSVSASFPPPGVSSSSSSSTAASAAAAPGRRRPLPGAPVRRGSSASLGGSGEVERERELGPIARAIAPTLQKFLEQARLEKQREREQGRLNQQQQQHRQGGQQQYRQHQHGHQRRQSEVLSSTHDYASRYGDSQGGIPPRPRTATEVGEVYRRGSVVNEREVEDEDPEGRGGAASGLLSLARS